MVVPVATPAQLRGFIRLPARLYARDANFIAPLELEREDALTRRSFSGGLMSGMVPLLIIDRLRQQAQARGLVSAELSWILEDNRPRRNLIEALGAEPYKTYRVYERALA
jgi:hypothetical protein